MKHSAERKYKDSKKHNLSLKSRGISLFYYRVTEPEDVINIEPNEYFDIPRELVIEGLNAPSMKAWSVLNGTKVIAIFLANEFYQDFYSIGIIVCKDIKCSELKYLKKAVKEVIDLYEAKYVYSEGETHPVRDRFHEYMGFEIEKNLLNKFKKWKYKDLEV